METLTRRVEAGAPPDPQGSAAARWVLVLVAPELASAALLAGAARQLDGAALPAAVLVAGAAMAARRARSGMLLRAAPAGDPSRPLHRRRALTLALAGAGTQLAVGTTALAVAPLRLLAAALGLVAADLVMAALGGGRRPRAVSAGPEGGQPGVRGRGRGGAAASAVAFAGTVGLHVLVLVKAAGSDDAGLLGTLAVAGLLPLIVTGTLPALFVHGLSEGRREAIVPALLCGAGLGSAAALLVTAAPAALLGVSDGGLAGHLPLVVSATVLLGLAQVLVHHLIAAGRSATASAHLGIAAAFQLAIAVTSTGAAAAVAVNALLGGALVLFTGLAVTTAVSAPYAPAADAGEAGDGPRRVGTAVAGLTAAAVAVRMATGRELWIDEAASARAAGGGLAAMLEAVRGSDPHPPLHTALVWLSRQVAGDGSAALRSPSLVAGALLVPLLYVTGAELYGRRVGLVAAALGAVAPPLVWFSVEARPPVLAALLATLSLLAMLRALRRGWASDWALFGLAGASLLWAHQLAWVHVAVLHGAAAFVVVRRRPDRPRGLAGWAGATALVAVAGVGLVAYRSGLAPPPALPPYEFATPAAPGEGTSLVAVIGSGVSALIGLHPPDVTSRLLALWPLGILFSLLALGRARSGRGALLLALSASPFVALFAAQLLGVPRHPAFALGWAATALPMVALLAARVTESIGGRWPRVRLVAGGLTLLLAVALVDQAARVRPLPRYDVGPLVAEAADRAEPGDAVVYEPRALADLVRYQAPRGVTVVEASAASPESLRPHGRVLVVAAFALSTSGESGDRVVGLVKDLSSQRRLVDERGRPDLKLWELR